MVGLGAVELGGDRWQAPLCQRVLVALEALFGGPALFVRVDIEMRIPLVEAGLPEPLPEIDRRLSGEGNGVIVGIAWLQ